MINAVLSLSFSPLDINLQGAASAALHRKRLMKVKTAINNTVRRRHTFLCHFVPCKNFIGYLMFKARLKGH